MTLSALERLDWRNAVARTLIANNNANASESPSCIFHGAYAVDQTSAHCRRRTHAGFDLIVVADGSASRLRDQVAPARLNRRSLWGAQWCLVSRGDWPWPDELQQRYVAARRMVGMLPVGTRPDDPEPRLSFFWSLPGAALDQGVVDFSMTNARFAQ